MRLTVLLVCLSILCTSSHVLAQTDTLIKKLDSMRKEEVKPGNKPIIDVDKDEYTSQTNIGFKDYFILLGTDLKQEVTSPFHATRKTYIKVGQLILLQGALFFADKPVQKFATNLMADNPGLRNVSTYVTDFGGLYEVYVLAAFGAYGVIFKSNKVKTTTLLATQAYITAGLMSSAVKYVTGRQRPNYYDAANPQPPDNTNFMGPAIFKGLGFSTGLNSSFPSGHTTAAFSAATVFAYEYKDQIIIPVVAYSAATLVGLSRITENAHWLTDVVAGAALGYITGKQVVNNYHRYARLKSGKQVKTTFLFDLQYRNGIIMPGLVCKF